MEFLYENRGAGTTVELKPGVAFCLRQFHGLIQELVQGAWVRYVRRQNSVLLGSTTDLVEFMFGSDRTNLNAVVPILKDVQRNLCFYCDRIVTGVPHVDHFIAWSRYPVDLGHNFVLTDASCNAAKADNVAAVEHLERWVERNADFHDVLENAFNDRGIMHDLAATTHIARWSYGQTESSQALTWLRQRELIPLRNDWRTILLTGDQIAGSALAP
jgi:hypothetical protein